MSAYAERLEALAADAADRCTTCGKCFEACPTAREIGLDAGAAKERVGELLALTRGEAPADGLQKWLGACDGSARCSEACPEGINVRQWVTIAKMKAVEATRPREVGAANAANRFRHMAQAVRLLASMQLPSETLKKILAPAERRTADVLFYTGCNVLRTPHIVLNVMDILDALELDFDVVGGTAHCCGVYQFQEADLPTYERMGHRTFKRFGQSGAGRVLTWCPTCTKNFDELEKDVEEPSFDLGHVSEFLAANLDALKARFVADQPKRRVVIHEHLGIGATVASIRKLLAAVPNLELLELPQDSGFSYACGGQAAKFKEREQAIHRGLAEGAVAAGADTIVTMYHSCHRALAGAEAIYPLKVVNFTDVLAEALGRGGHPDYYRLYKQGGAMDEAVSAARRFLQDNGVRVDEASVASLTADIFNETGWPARARPSPRPSPRWRGKAEPACASARRRAGDGVRDDAGARARPDLKGRPVSTITARLGPPDSQQQIDGRTAYVWTWKPARRHAGAVDPQLRAGVPNTIDTLSYPDPPRMDAARCAPSSTAGNVTRPTGRAAMPAAMTPSRSWLEKDERDVWLFSYGTLQQEDVQLATFGRRLEGRADALPGYATSLFEITDADVIATSGKTHHLMAPSDRQSGRRGRGRGLPHHARRARGSGHLRGVGLQAHRRPAEIRARGVRLRRRLTTSP